MIFPYTMLNLEFELEPRSCAFATNANKRLHPFLPRKDVTQQLADRNNRRTNLLNRSR
jgi:hypothetical protein